jgi:hypothetical protein
MSVDVENITIITTCVTLLSLYKMFVPGHHARHTHTHRISILTCVQVKSKNRKGETA